VSDIGTSNTEMGTLGMIFLILRAYSMGAGTFTGIEAVSNGMSILRDPKVQTAKRTMNYMAVSLATIVAGLMVAYLLFGVRHVPGKTLNAVLFESMTSDWGMAGTIFVFVTLFSEATLLFVAAQTGFLGGPGVLSSMALDRWAPGRFASLNDRLVTQNGILIMGIGAIVLMIYSRGSVKFLVILYSINVFVTFTLSQLGMVRHWWQSRKKVEHWRKKLTVNGIGLILTIFILVSVVVLKFNEGGWITILVTGTLVIAVCFIKRHYRSTARLLRSLDSLVAAAECESVEVVPGRAPVSRPTDPQARTAVLLVNGFSGMGLHTLFNVFRLFGDSFRNFIFVQVGMVDTGIFKGPEDIQRLQAKVREDLDRYVAYVKARGYWADGFPCLGTDVVDEVTRAATMIHARYPQSVFFGGRLVFPQDSFVSRWLHNHVIFSVQKNFHHLGIPFFVVPIRV